MIERQCVHIAIQDPTFVICASHGCLGLFLRADIESLVVDTLEAAFHHCISLLLCLKDTLVQLVVLSPCLDMEGLPQLHHVIIFVLWHHLSLHIIDALFVRRNDGIVQCVVRFDETVEHGFLSCNRSMYSSLHCLPRDSQYLRSCCLVCAYKSRLPPSVCATMERSGLLMSFNESLN